MMRSRYNDDSSGEIIAFLLISYQSYCCRCKVITFHFISCFVTVEYHLFSLLSPPLCSHCTVGRTAVVLGDGVTVNPVKSQQNFFPKSNEIDPLHVSDIHCSCSFIFHAIDLIFKYRRDASSSSPPSNPISSTDTEDHHNFTYLNHRKMPANSAIAMQLDYIRSQIAKIPVLKK
jgi:hypothetical protein